MVSKKFNIALTIKKKQGIVVDGTDNDITNAIIHLNQLSSGHVHVEDLILNELPDSHQRMISHIIQERHFNNIVLKQLIFKYNSF